MKISCHSPDSTLLRQIIIKVSFFFIILPFIHGCLQKTNVDQMFDAIDDYSKSELNEFQYLIIIPYDRGCSYCNDLVVTFLSEEPIKKNILVIFLSRPAKSVMNSIKGKVYFDKNMTIQNITGNVYPQMLEIESGAFVTLDNKSIKEELKVLIK
jgi:hypothetical protein